MTISRQPIQIGVRELRDRIRSVVEQVRDGQPFMVLSNSEPLAVLLSHDEIDRWESVEFSLAALHGMEIYPELSRGTSELASLVRGERKYSKGELEGLYQQRHQIVGPVRGGSVSYARAHMAEILAQVMDDEMQLIASGGELVAAFIRVKEYERLLKLRRIVAWFRAAGLDLTTAYEDEDRIVTWVRAYRAGPASAEADEKPAIA